MIDGNDEHLSNDERVARIVSEVDYHIACIEDCEDDLSADEKKRKVDAFLRQLSETLVRKHPSLPGTIR